MNKRKAGSERNKEMASRRKNPPLAKESGANGHAPRTAEKSAAKKGKPVAAVSAPAPAAPAARVVKDVPKAPKSVRPAKAAKPAKTKVVKSTEITNETLPLSKEPVTTPAATPVPVPQMTGEPEDVRPHSRRPEFESAHEDTTEHGHEDPLPPPIDSDLAEQILKNEPFIGEQYNQTYLYGLVANARHAFIFYEVSSGAREHLKQKYGQNFFDHNYLVLRIRRTDTGHTWDIEDYLDAKNSYWIKIEPDVEHEAELGYRAKGTKFFEPVAVSNRFRSLPEVEMKHETQGDTREIKVDYEGQIIPVDKNDWRFNVYEYWKRRSTEKKEESGYWALILHMHLPFVRHLEYPVALEEQWLFEAITSCYAPLLKMMWNLERDKIDFRLTVSISAPLMSMLCDEPLQDRYRVFLHESIRLAEKELHNNKGKVFQHTIETILDRLHNARKVFEAYGGNILNGFRDFQDMGKLEVMICAGTHPILPYYLHSPEIVRGHIQLACRQYQGIFGRWPRGMWLPENAFTPGLDHFLAAEGIKWTIMNSTGITRGNTRSWFNTYRPVVTHNNLAVFGIDEDTRAQVWSREAGYPGDPRYKEWYRDLGYDAGWDYLPEYFKTANVRRNTGLKYYRITSKTSALNEKQPYNPGWAWDAVNEQAGQFVFHRGTQANFLRSKYKTKPIAVSAYDAELFGHWWEEGPHWIETVFRKMCCDQSEVRPVTPTEFLAEHSRHQLLMPGASTWGKKATFETWLDGRTFRPNTWVYRHLFRISNEMSALATDRKDATGLEARALNQAAREMMLAQSSDWPFLISMDQSSRYAEVRLIKHIDRAKELLRQIAIREINMQYLATLEAADTLFAGDQMDFRVFCRS